MVASNLGNSLEQQTLQGRIGSVTLNGGSTGVGVAIPQRPGFRFSRELQVPIEKIGAPVPMVRVPFALPDTILQPIPFRSTEIKGQIPARVSGGSLTKPISTQIPGRFFQGGENRPIASTAVASAEQQSEQLPRAFNRTMTAGIIAVAVVAFIAIVAAL